MLNKGLGWRLAVLTTGWMVMAAHGDVPQIPWINAAQHYGETCEVVGVVVAAKDIGSRCFLNFSDDYKTSFTVVINKESYDAFPKPPQRMYTEKWIAVTGEIIEYKNKPEIVATSPDQIRILDPQDGIAIMSKAVVEPKATPPTEAAPEPKSAAPPASASNTSFPPRNASDAVIRIGTFNVFNLFDDYDDPYIENERLPGKSKEELALLGETIHRLDADVLALQEVENRPFLETFAREYLKDMGYKETVLIEGNNERGIDVALLSRFPVGPVTSYRHEDFPDGNGDRMRFQRDLLRVNIRPPGQADFDVFVVHLKSKYGGEEASLPLRMGEAKRIRTLLDDILAKNPQARFVICGDFNDTFESEPVQTIVGSGRRALKPFFTDLPEDQRITYNHGHLSMIDYILASPAMAASYRQGSYGVLMGTVESSGSDHNPVKADFNAGGSSNRN